MTLKDRRKKPKQYKW